MNSVAVQQLGPDTILAQPVLVGQSLTINNPLGFVIEPKMLSKVLGHCALYMTTHPVIQISVGITERVPSNAPMHRHPGWLEYSIVINTPNSMVYVAAVQRKPTTEVEFHS
jgi:hypothetical protein